MRLFDAFGMFALGNTCLSLSVLYACVYIRLLVGRRFCSERKMKFFLTCPFSPSNSPSLAAFVLVILSLVLHLHDINTTITTTTTTTTNAAATAAVVFGSA